MKGKGVSQLPLFRNSKAASPGYASIILNKEKFAHMLEGHIASDDLTLLKNKIFTLNWGNFIPQIPHQMISRFSRQEGALL